MLTITDIEEICRLGGMAPSGGNVQPWKVIADTSSIELWLDPERATSFIDVGHYASVFSLGSFLENACIVSDCLGLRYRIVIHEEIRLDTPIMTIQYFDRFTGPERNLLYDQISRRRTNRRRGNSEILCHLTIDQLSSAIKEWSSITLSAVSGKSDKCFAVRILGEADAIRIQHDKLFTQMMEELRWNREETLYTMDGIDIDTLEIPKLAVLFLHTLKKYPALRTWLPQSVSKSFSKAPVLNCSHLCLLSIYDDFSTDSLVNAGRAVQRLWLKSTELELELQPMTVLPFFLIRSTYFSSDGFSDSQNKRFIKLGKDIRALFKLPGSQFPLFIFRLSKAPEPTGVALRRPWQNYTTVQENVRCHG